MPGMFLPEVLEPDPETIATYKSPQIGDFLRQGLVETYPTTKIEFVVGQRDGHEMISLVVRTDPITASEMKAFAGGFFRAFNNRYALG